MSFPARRPPRPPSRSDKMASEANPTVKMKKTIDDLSQLIDILQRTGDDQAVLLERAQNTISQLTDHNKHLTEQRDNYREERDDIKDERDNLRVQLRHVEFVDRQGPSSHEKADKTEKIVRLLQEHSKKLDRIDNKIEVNKSELKKLEQQKNEAKGVQFMGQDPTGSPAASGTSVGAKVRSMFNIGHRQDRTPSGQATTPGDAASKVGMLRSQSVRVSSAPGIAARQERESNRPQVPKKSENHAPRSQSPDPLHQVRKKPSSFALRDPNAPCRKSPTPHRRNRSPSHRDRAIRPVDYSSHATRRPSTAIRVVGDDANANPQQAGSIGLPTYQGISRLSLDGDEWIPKAGGRSG